MASHSPQEVPQSAASLRTSVTVIGARASAGVKAWASHDKAQTVMPTRSKRATPTPDRETDLAFVMTPHPAIEARTTPTRDEVSQNGVVGDLRQCSRR